MFASNLNSVVEMLGEDYHFEAVAYTNIYEEVENYDVILIAPQIGYLLKRLKESLPDKLVLQIPTAIFAGYDAIGAIKFIQNEIDQFQKEKKEKQEIKCHCCKHYNRRVLSIVLSANRAQTRIYYRIYDNNDIMDQQIIIKPTLNTNDLYDVIDTVLLKVKHLDAIAIAIPGIIKENDHLRSSIDGKDIRNVEQKELRNKIGYVPQKGILLAGTIRSNLLYANPNASDEDIDEALRISQSKEFVDTKPLGVDEPISQGGTNVSGGQKQRLSIARAIIKKPEIYIFDDSFSALDFKTDAALREELMKSCKKTGSTVLLVAQRISSILHADQIIVLDEGRMVGKGTHQELIKSCRIYQEIASSQLSKEELANV